MAGRRSRGHGMLETEVMRVLWQFDEPVGAGAIREAFDDDSRPALTTLLTVLERLRGKGMVIRDEVSPRRVRFFPARREDEEASMRMLDALDTTDDRRAALLRFAGNLADDDVALLRRALDSRPREV